MKFLVALLGLASVALASVPLDTPEVAAAKAAHFAAHAAARGHLWHPVLYAGHYAHGAAPLGPGGVVVDTPEVAAAKAQHYHAHAAARTGAAVIPAVHAAGVVVPSVVVKAEDDGQWHGEGLLESQDIHSAPVVHAAPVVHGAAVTAYAAAPVASAWHAYGHGAKWVGPIALPPGYDANGAPLPVQDTPEVAAAKANHLAILHGAHAGASAHSIYHDVNSGEWNAALWGDHSHRWRRSAVLLRTPAATTPLVHHAYAVHTPVVHHHVTPLVRSWGYSSVAPLHHIW